MTATLQDASVIDGTTQTCRPAAWYMRNPRQVAVTTGDRLLLVDGKGGSIGIPTEDPARWSHLLQVLAQPQPAQVLWPHMEALPELDDALWARLIAAGAILDATDEAALTARQAAVFADGGGLHLVPGEAVCRHLVVACTGSVVAGLMAPAILSLCYAGFQEELDVVLSESAQKFLTRDLLESYGIRTWGHTFERRDGVAVPHVHLGQSADCILVMPATANSLHRLAGGACCDLLSTAVAASEAPVVVCPAMNATMWNHKPVQRNVRTLREDGVYVIEPSLIFAAADFACRGKPMFGGHGTLWAGPAGLMQALKAILAVAGSDSEAVATA